MLFLRRFFLSFTYWILLQSSARGPSLGVLLPPSVLLSSESNLLGKRYIHNGGPRIWEGAKYFLLAILFFLHLLKCFFYTFLKGVTVSPPRQKLIILFLFVKIFPINTYPNFWRLEQSLAKEIFFYNIC